MCILSQVKRHSDILKSQADIHGNPDLPPTSYMNWSRNSITESLASDLKKMEIIILPDSQNK